MVNGGWWIVNSDTVTSILTGQMLCWKIPSKERKVREQGFPNWAGNKGETSKAPFQDKGARRVGWVDPRITLKNN